MSSALAPVSNGVEAEFITPQQVELLKFSVMKGANDLELDLFLNLCRAKRLDPLTKQIYAIKTGAGWQYFASIDGLRVIAQRSGEYAGQVGPFWCGSGGEWTDVWLQAEAPAAAKVGVLRLGWTEPMWGVATMKSYGTGKQSPTWKTMTDIMLAKCAESIALRKAFPDDLSGLYVREEFTEDAPSKRSETFAKAHDILDLAERAFPERTPEPDADDIIDAETGEIAEAPITQAQLRRLVELKTGLNWPIHTMRKYAGEETGKENANDLTQSEAEALIGRLESVLDAATAPDEDEGQMPLT